jgi:2-polyprenyl-3-methyl-5-hydroxy-6-metoxy-1,4-benzoquinol methylase
MHASTHSTVSLICPACGAPEARSFPASRKTGRVVAGCKACGCHWLTNPPSAAAILDHSIAFERAIYESFVNAKRADRLDRDYRSTLRRIDEMIGSGGRALFDVGAGAGEFLFLARQYGFEPYGNEFAPGAIEMARERTGIDLHVGDLATIDGTDLYDAVTMWCVLAHVSEPDDLLRNVLRVLKPGGILFVQTPRWSAMDAAALGAARASGGRLVRLLDRRISDQHMTLHSRRGLAAQATRLGFEVVEVHPRARYSLNTQEYLRSLGMPARARRGAARALDLVVDRDLVFRNVLDLYARKPPT